MGGRLYWEIMKAIDLFAGAGGFSTGAVMAGCSVVWAANHWPAAVAVHADNHPDTVHTCQDLQQADWTRVPAHDLLMASPACRGHSRAKARNARTMTRCAARHGPWCQPPNATGPPWCWSRMCPSSPHGRYIRRVRSHDGAGLRPGTRDHRCGRSRRGSAPPTPVHRLHAQQHRWISASKPPAHVGSGQIIDFDAGRWSHIDKPGRWRNAGARGLWPGRTATGSSLRITATRPAGAVWKTGSRAPSPRATGAGRDRWRPHAHAKRARMPPRWAFPTTIACPSGPRTPCTCWAMPSCPWWRAT